MKEIIIEKNLNNTLKLMYKIKSKNNLANSIVSIKRKVTMAVQ